MVCSWCPVGNRFFRPFQLGIFGGWSGLKRIGLAGGSGDTFQMAVASGEMYQHGWWPWGRRRVRMAFPCPACFQPLMAFVEPDLDLECPICRTTFRVPAPPAAAPPAQKVYKPDQGYGVWAQVLFALGLVVFIISIVAACVGITHLLIGCLVVTMLGALGAWFRNYWQRWSNPDVPKLSAGKHLHESIQAVGGVSIGLCALPCLGCLLLPVLGSIRSFGWLSLF